jgi:hypothetical protein
MMKNMIKNDKKYVEKYVENYDEKYVQNMKEKKDKAIVFAPSVNKMGYVNIGERKIRVFIIFREKISPTFFLLIGHT